MTPPRQKESDHAPPTSTSRASGRRRRAGGEDRGSSCGRLTRPIADREDRGGGRGRHTWPRSPTHLVPARFGSSADLARARTTKGRTGGFQRRRPGGVGEARRPEGFVVGDTGLEPVTSPVSGKINKFAGVRGSRKRAGRSPYGVRRRPGTFIGIRGGCGYQFGYRRRVANGFPHSATSAREIHRPALFVEDGAGVLDRGPN